MPKVYWGEVKDPVHGYVYISKEEKDILDSYPMQRLRRLRQLAGSEYVYPGANHTRFEHCVGVMYLAGQVLENPNIGSLLSEEEAAMCRISALLHDVGHGPFSHVFEQLLIKDLEKTHEDITSWLILKSEVGDKLSKMGYNPEEVASLAVGGTAGGGDDTAVFHDKDRRADEYLQRLDHPPSCRRLQRAVHAHDPQELFRCNTELAPRGGEDRRGVSAQDLHAHRRPARRSRHRERARAHLHLLVERLPHAAPFRAQGKHVYGNARHLLLHGGQEPDPEMVAQLYAALVLMTIPSIVIYIASQKYFQEGLTAGAIKQ